MFEVIDPNFSMLMERTKQTMKYYPSSVCACLKENDGSFDPSCGCIQGYWYSTPESVIVMRQQVSTKILNTPNGIIYNGGAQITLPKFYLETEQLAHKTLGRGDIFVAENKKKKETDILKRGTRDFLFAFDVDDILKVSRKSTAYVAGTDYTITKDQSTPVELTQIVWEVGHGPEEDEYYTVDFISRQQFKVWEDAGNDRGTDDDILPRKVMCVIRKYVETKVNNVDSIELQQKIF